MKKRELLTRFFSLKATKHFCCEFLGPFKLNGKLEKIPGFGGRFPAISVPKSGWREQKATRIGFCWPSTMYHIGRTILLNLSLFGFRGDGGGKASWWCKISETFQKGWNHQLVWDFVMSDVHQSKMPLGGEFWILLFYSGPRVGPRRKLIFQLHSRKHGHGNHLILMVFTRKHAVSPIRDL